MTVYMFPGQGSQFKGMGVDLFSHFPTLLAEVDLILGYSLKELCLKDPYNRLNQTRYTQPALYTVNALSYLKKIRDGFKPPDYLIGHSLGEYNALAAAGVFDFFTGLRLVAKRGELMGEAMEGAMSAVLGLSAERVSDLLREHASDRVSIANYNSYSQIVISGDKSSVEAINPIFTDSGGKVIPLNVSGAFHSPLMRDAQNIFAEFLRRFDFLDPKIPVIANIDAKPYTKRTIFHKLSSQLTGCVLWCSSIEYLLKKGEQVFEEIGPGQVSTRLVERIKNGE